MTTNAALPALLPLAVHVELERLAAAGGPTSAELATAREYGVILATRGDALLYSERPGERRALFSQLARSIAVAAYAPGGVTVLGTHYTRLDDPTRPPG